MLNKSANFPALKKEQYMRMADQRKEFADADNIYKSSIYLCDYH